MAKNLRYQRMKKKIRSKLKKLWRRMKTLEQKLIQPRHIKNPKRNYWKAKGKKTKKKKRKDKKEF
jgi:hypothetical protein